MHYFSKIPDFYYLNNLGPNLISTIIADIVYVPPHYMKTFISSFLFSVITSCPKEQMDAVNLPLMIAATGYLNSRIDILKGMLGSVETNYM